jgi:spore coat protein CotF
MCTHCPNASHQYFEVKRLNSDDDYYKYYTVMENINIRVMEAEEKTNTSHL